MRLDQCGSEAFVEFGGIVAAGEGGRRCTTGDDADGLDKQPLAGACTAECRSVAEKTGGSFQGGSTRCGQHGGESGAFIQTSGATWSNNLDPKLMILHSHCVGKCKCAKSVPYTQKCRRRFLPPWVLGDVESGDVVAPQTSSGIVPIHAADGPVIVQDRC